MIHAIDGETADDVWCKAAEVFASSNGVLEQCSRSGKTRELLHACLSIENPRQRWVYSRRPPINVAYALAEIIWIIAGRNDSAFLNHFNRQLPFYAGTGVIYHGAYGRRLRSSCGSDQIERAFNALTRNPDSRQVVLQIWESACDFPGDSGQPVSQDVPCNIVGMLKVRDERLEWTQVMRSNDLFRGLPYNIVQFTVLQEIIAGWLNLHVGSYVHYSDSLHVYDSDLPNVQRSRHEACPESNDSLALPKSEFDLVFGDLERQANVAIDSTTSSRKILEMVVKSAMPRAYRNILCVICAECLRRRKEVDLAQDAMRSCTNAALLSLYERWMDRMRSRKVGAVNPCNEVLGEA